MMCVFGADGALTDGFLLLFDYRTNLSNEHNAASDLHPDDSRHAKKDM